MVSTNQTMLISMAKTEKHDTPEVLTVLNPVILCLTNPIFISANKLVIYQKKKMLI